MVFMKTIRAYSIFAYRAALKGVAIALVMSIFAMKAGPQAIERETTFAVAGDLS